MFDAQRSKQPEQERSQAEPVQKTNETNQHTRYTGDLTRIPLYTQLAWGNQPPPWLRLPIQRKQPHEEEAFQERDELPTPRKENTTGLPDTLKAGIENLSGLSLDDVRVHYNSPQPAQVQALAYTQGTVIHVGPGQEKHLAHEAWHVVQQKQGRVQPTVQMKGIKINDDQGLEREADVIGGEALQYKEIQESRRTSHDTEASVNTGEVVQRAVITEDIEGSDQPGTLTYTDQVGAHLQNEVLLIQV